MSRLLDLFYNQGGMAQYWQQVRALYGSALIGYWPMWEPSGTILTDISDIAGNGTYKNSPTLGEPGIGDGKTSIKLNGTDQVALNYTAALAAAVNLGEGGIFVWAKVADATIWTDGQNRCLLHLGVDTANYIRVMKVNVNNQIQAVHRVGATNIVALYTGINTANWFRIGCTWSRSNNRLRLYINGVQVGSEGSGLAAMTGPITSAYTVIGGQTSTPALPWAGWLAHALILNAEVV